MHHSYATFITYSLSRSHIPSHQAHHRDKNIIVTISKYPLKLPLHHRDKPPTPPSPIPHCHASLLPYPARYTNGYHIISSRISSPTNRLTSLIFPGFPKSATLLLPPNDVTIEPLIRQRSKPNQTPHGLRHRNAAVPRDIPQMNCLSSSSDAREAAAVGVAGWMSERRVSCLAWRVQRCGRGRSRLFLSPASLDERMDGG